MGESSAGNCLSSPTITTNIVTTTSVTTYCTTVRAMTTCIATPSETPYTPARQSTSEQMAMEHNSLPWQTISPRKRRPREIEGEPTQKRKNATIVPSDDGIISTNRYAALNATMDENEEHLEKGTNTKPPPIFIQGVTNYPSMKTSIETVLTKEEFICKTLPQNTIKVYTNTSKAYRTLIHFLKNNNIAHHTYQPREERAYRVVIKNIHQSVPPQDIKEELEGLGFRIRNVTNIRSWNTKDPLHLFFVDQEPDAKNKEIYQLKHLLGTKITVEPPRKRKEIPQCQRCQEYGHTKAYCSKPYSCVKCGENHPTQVCQKTKMTPATCALCDGPHPANYKGCSVYRDLQKSRSDRQKRNQHQPQRNTINNQTIDTATLNNNLTYAQITAQSQQFNLTPEDNTARDDTDTNLFSKKLEKIMEQLINQNNMILNLLTTIINNFCKK